MSCPLLPVHVYFHPSVMRNANRNAIAGLSPVPAGYRLSGGAFFLCQFMRRSHFPAGFFCMVFPFLCLAYFHPCFFRCRMSFLYLAHFPANFWVCHMFFNSLAQFSPSFQLFYRICTNPLCHYYPRSPKQLFFLLLKRNELRFIVFLKVRSCKEHHFQYGVQRSPVPLSPGSMFVEYIPKIT